MASFASCRSIGSAVLKRNDQLRTLLINNDELVHFTRMEYRLILALLNSETVADAFLVQTLFDTNTLDRLVLKGLEKHVENAKAKLRYTGLYIRRIHRYGYSLVEEPCIERAAAS
jgi:DNA-binding winged helix-turn-helix (wHTH) protein